MKLGIFTTVFERPTLERTLDAVRSGGFESVQFGLSSAGLSDTPDVLDADFCDRIRQGFAERGIEMAALSGTVNMIHPNKVEREKALRRLATLIASARGMGTDIVTLCTGTRDPGYLWRYHPENGSPGAWTDLLDAMEQTVRIAERHGVVVAFEPEVNNVVDSADKARRLIDEIGSPHLKVVIDGANLFHAGELPRMAEVLDHAFVLLGEHIVLAHAKDLRRDGDAGHDAAGTGLLDYNHYLRLLKETGFTGSVVLHSLTEAQVPDCLAFVRGKLERLKTG
ncbi:MAG: sugar phosphate isomerase/epimerase [candidate division Zixibacteria bacterium]|nr:sugar phosphate isomerase/epimerase [candidate division Zixibacteria bacterium]